METTIRQSWLRHCRGSFAAALASFLSFPFSRGRKIFAMGLLLSVLVLPGLVQGQVEVIYDWNGTNDVGWLHYDPGTAGGQTNSRTFPPDGSGGAAYRQVGPNNSSCVNIINRGGAYRSEQYTEFFQSVDIVNFDPNTIGSLFSLGSRITTPGAGTTSGYIAGYFAGDPRARQEIFGNIEFTSEITSTVLNPYRGGRALTSRFPPSRKLRAVFSGINDTFKTELYDQTDLLEPIVRINFQDGYNAAAHPNGANAIGWINLEFTETCDFTWDNYLNISTTGSDRVLPRRITIRQDFNWV